MDYLTRTKSTWKCKLTHKISLALVVSCVSILPYNAPAHTAPTSWSSYYAAGDTALGHQNLQLAEENFKKAASLTESKSADSSARHKCLQKLAETLALRNKTGEANAIYEQLLSSMSKRQTPSKELVPVLMSLGSIQESLGNHNAAINYYLRALRINEKNDGRYSPAFTATLQKIVTANSKLGGLDQSGKAKQSRSDLSSQPSLEASERLQKILRRQPDLIKSDDDSDTQLVKDFYRDLGIPKDPNATSNSNQNGSHSHNGSNKSEVVQNSVGPDQQRMTPESTPALRPYSAVQPTSALLAANLNQQMPREINQTGISNFAIHDQAPGSGPTGMTQPVQLDSRDSALMQDDIVSSAWQKQGTIQLKASAVAQLDEDPVVALRGIQNPWNAKSMQPAYQAVKDAIMDQGRYAEGETYYQRIIAVDLNAIGPHHPSLANDLNGLALFYIREKRYAEAEPLLVRALSIYNEAYGSDNVLWISTCASLARVEFQLEKISRSIELYRDALSHSESALGPNNYQTASILNELAFLYFHQGKLQDSLTMYKWAAASTEAAVGPQSPSLAACLKDYAKVLRNLGQTSEADTIDLRASYISAGTK